MLEVVRNCVRATYTQRELGERDGEQKREKKVARGNQTGFNAHGLTGKPLYHSSC